MLIPEVLGDQSEHGAAGGHSSERHTQPDRAQREDGTRSKVGYEAGAEALSGTESCGRPSAEARPRCFGPGWASRCCCPESALGCVCARLLLALVPTSRSSPEVASELLDPQAARERKARSSCRANVAPQRVEGVDRLGARSNPGSTRGDSS